MKSDGPTNPPVVKSANDSSVDNSANELSKSTPASPAVRKKLPKLPYRSLVMATLGLFTGLTILLAFFLWKTFHTILVPSEKPVISATNSATLEPKKSTAFSLLLLGYGGNGHEGGLLTDTIMLAHVQPDKKTITLITIPRDLWVSFPSSDQGETAWKINAAYQIGADDRSYPNKPDKYKGESGGGELAKYAVSKVTGLPVDNFVAVSFAGFTQTVDILGGLDIQVEKTFDDYWYPIEGEEDNSCGRTPEDIEALTATMSGYLLEQQFPCRYETLHFERGLNTMDGETALKYARSRHSSQDGSDFARSQRQKQVILAARQKALSLNVLPKLIPLLNSVGHNLRTDLSLEKIQEFISKRDEYRDYTIYSLALTDKNVLKHGRSANGQYILLPDESALDNTGETNTTENWEGLHSWIAQYLENPATATQ